jgi:hypothetical protein
VADQLTTLYRPIGRRELELIIASGYAAFPPRLPQQPIFYPVATEAYAIQIARDWNTRDEASGYVGYVTRFRVPAAFLARYPRRVVGASVHEEYWVPAEELSEFNAQIVGPIEVIAEFRPDGKPREPAI